MRKRSLIFYIIVAVGATFLALVGVLWGLAYQTLTVVMDQSQAAVYQERASVIHSTVQRKYDKLIQTGMQEYYEFDFKKQVLNELRVAYGTSQDAQSFLVILDSTGKTLLNAHPNISDSALVQAIPQKQNGFVSVHLSKQVYWVHVIHFKPWNWSISHWVPESVKYADRNRFLTWFLPLAIMLSLGLMAFVGWFLKRILAPIQELIQATTSIASGNLSVAVSVSGVGELRDLSHNFSVMREAIIIQMENLRENEAVFRSIVENSPIGYQMFALNEGEQLSLQMYNTAAEALLHTPHGPFVGQNIQPETPILLGDPGLYMGIIQGAMPTQYFEVEKTVLGEVWVYDVRVFAGAPGQVVVNFIDITERRRAEKAITHGQKLLADKNKELEQLIYVATHDLRSPLVNVEGFSWELSRSLKAVFDALEESRDSSRMEPVLRNELPEMNMAIERIRLGINQMSRLLNGLLHLARLGRDPVHVGPIDMNTYISQLYGVFRSRLEQANVLWEQEELPSCMADPVLLSQVFSHLIDNAIKYLDKSRRGKIRIEGHVESSRSVYRVIDNGIGIEDAYQQKIFDLFYQLNPREYQGEGLGLPVIRLIMNRLDGEIRVESKAGYGSVFVVTLLHH